MLVLSRKLGEKVEVAFLDDKGDVVAVAMVTVVDIDSGKIRLGFDGPGSVRFMREELLPGLDGNNGMNGGGGDLDDRPTA